MERTAFKVDPVTVEVVGNALLSVAEEMGEALVKAAYSDNIKERRDSSAGIFDAQGRTLAQAAHIPIHLGSLLGVAEAVVQRYPRSEIHEGDMFIGNDAYEAGGTHLPDIVVTAPIFHKGVLIGFVANLGHHADFFDRGEGRHIWQEGLRIPAIRIMERGKVRQDVLDFILLNCQLPKERIGDFRAQFAANRLGIRRVQELCDRYGVQQFFATVEELLDYTERRMRAGIRQIPDGVYAFQDDLDSEYFETLLKLVVKITKEKEDITLDFTGCPPQVPAGLNMQWTAILATCYYGVKTLVDPDIPPNAGFYRAIRVIAPKGTIVNCVEPAAVYSRTQTCQRVVDLIHGALAPALPQRVTAAHNGANTRMGFHGINGRTGERFNYIETLGGGFGARATKDGLDGVQVHMTNTSNLPIEALESTYPLLVKRYELVTDSGGPGKWRGGMGFVRHIEVLEGELDGGAGISRGVVPPWGLFGGKPGSTQQVEITRTDGAVERPPRGVGGRRPATFRSGDGLAVTTSGGGGYGDPGQRDRWRVKQDLKEGRISRRSAIEDYGLTPEEVDGVLTEEK
ncbi:MAG: hydantoinase B/oxoprolinase family protein [Chloroflexi bacterium]|nr:hydantoinase B/oxoprolinase family protein [Chloroflexota bacterium]